MKLSKTKLKAIGKKLAERGGPGTDNSYESRLARFLELHNKGLAQTKDGRIITHAQWVEEQPEPLRSTLKRVLSEQTDTSGKDLSE